VFSLGSVATGGSVNPMDVPEAAWPAIIAIGFLASFLAIQAFYAGARRIGAAQAALLSTVEPLTIVVLAGIFLGERAENEWFMTGMALLSPEAWRDFNAASGRTDDKTSLLEAYVALLNDPDPAINGPAAEAWGLYEARSSTLLPNPDLMAEMSGPAKALALARIEAHYFRHDCFLAPGQLLDGVAKIRHLPATIIQGRYDLLCPIGVADSLSQAWPEAEYVVVPDAGHSAFEPGIARALVAAAKRMATRLG